MSIKSLELVMCKHSDMGWTKVRSKDTLGHTSTPAFSVDSELLCYLAGHADAFEQCDIVKTVT